MGDGGGATKIQKRWGGRGHWTENYIGLSKAYKRVISFTGLKFFCFDCLAP